MFPPSLYLSIVFTCKMSKMPESGWSISHHDFLKNKPKASKIDYLWARSTCEQDRSVCVILHVQWSLFFLPPCFLPPLMEGSCKPKLGLNMTTWRKNGTYNFSWRSGRIVTFFWCINDVCNMCVCDFASQETCLCDYLCAVQIFVWFTYSLASMKKNKTTGAG
jgi:hypothetical protein